MTTKTPEDRSLELLEKSELMIQEAGRQLEAFERFYDSKGLKRGDLRKIIDEEKKYLTKMELDEIDREERSWREEMERDLAHLSAEDSYHERSSPKRMRPGVVKV